MKVSFDLDSVAGVAVCVFEGQVGLEEMRASASKGWELAKGSHGRILWDLREASYDASTTDVRQLAEYVKTAKPPGRLRSAFLVSEDLHFGLARMFGIFRETEDTETAVFRDRKEALAWLRGAG